ncbi:MAG: PaaI family thioesterase [candidate division NC10 bacterium]|nr:PaaI family thioesterase [candidate division NC10 bacterium]
MREEKEGETKSGSYLRDLKEKLGKDPFAQFLGIRVLDLGEGWAQLEMPLQHQMSNFMGSIHGGAIFSLADHAFAAASNSRGTPAVALHLNITYFSVPPAGSILRAEARELHLTRRTATYGIKIWTREGSQVASCQGIAYRRSREHAPEDEGTGKG